LAFHLSPEFLQVSVAGATAVGFELKLTNKNNPNTELGNASSSLAGVAAAVPALPTVVV
jgi:hypothetical protein